MIARSLHVHGSIALGFFDVVVPCLGLNLVATEQERGSFEQKKHQQQQQQQHAPRGCCNGKSKARQPVRVILTLTQRLSSPNFPSIARSGNPEQT